MPAGLGLRSGVVSPQRYVAKEFSRPNFLRIFCAGATGLFVSMAVHLVSARFPLLVAQFPSRFLSAIRCTSSITPSYGSVFSMQCSQ